MCPPSLIHFLSGTQLLSARRKGGKKLAEKNWAVPGPIIYQATSGFRICYLKTEFSVMSNAPNKKEIPGCIGFQYGELQNLKNSET